MKRLLALLFLCAVARVWASVPADTCNHRLYYTAPASIWEETLPLGNGRLGMMPDGGIRHERVVLNEISCGAAQSPITVIPMPRAACRKSANCFSRGRTARRRN